MEKIRLLIASDFQLARMGLRQIVNALQGTEVVAESELQTALPKKVQEIGPDVVLLDLAVPKPHNLPALSQLLKNNEPKVVVMSTNENVGYVRSLMAAGVRGYVLRSASPEELLLAIQATNQGHYFIDPRLSDAVAEILITGQPANSSHGNLSKREVQVLAHCAWLYKSGNRAAVATESQNRGNLQNAHLREIRTEDAG